MPQNSQASILVITSESPCPPTHGGRIDTFQRLSAFKKFGLNVRLLTWYDPQLGETEKTCRQQLGKLVTESYLFPKNGLATRLKPYLSYPLWLARRLIPRDDLQQLSAKLRLLDVGVVFLDGLYGAAALDQLNSIQLRPYVYRSHNVEHNYVKQLGRVATGFKERLRWKLANIGLKSMELRIVANANCFYDISARDLIYWNKLGLSHGEWLPTLYDDRTIANFSNLYDWSPNFDVGYFGNLFAPNNVHGILWFITHVVPKLKRKRPNIRIFIAGSRPAPTITNACLNAGITLFDNPADSFILYRNAKSFGQPNFLRERHQH